MTLVKRSGALILALTMMMVLLVGCSSQIDVKQNPNGSYGVDITEAGTDETKSTADKEAQNSQQNAQQNAASDAQPANTSASGAKTVDTTTKSYLEMTNLFMPSGDKGRKQESDGFLTIFGATTSFDELVKFYKEKIEAIGAKGDAITRADEFKFTGKYDGYKDHVKKEGTRDISIQVKTGTASGIAIWISY